MDFDIVTFLEKYYKKGEKIILACSAGADSMFVLHHILKSEYKNNLVICYFNHKTRSGCDEEELFLEKLSKEEGCSFEVAECDFEKIQKLYPSKGFEELAREKRYQFFEAVCNIYSADKVITAHHLDDRIETYMFNMLRGSKLTGLINMTESSGGILRPILGIEKTEIYAYLEKNELTYFEDETNTDNSYTRNYLRNEVLPMFNKVHPEHKKNLQNLLTYFEEVKLHLDSEVKEFLGNGGNFSILAFNALSSLLQKEIIRQIFYLSNGNSTIGLSEGNISEVIRFINGKNNKTKKDIHEMNLSKDGDLISY